MSSLMQRLSANLDWIINQANFQVDNQYIGYKTLEEEIERVEILNQAWRTAKNKVAKQDDKTIAKMCYTLDKPRFYETLNSELRKWYRSQKKENFPFNNYTRLMESQTEKVSSLTLWRGINNKEFDLQTKGDNIISNQFFSCSILKETAEGFAKQNGDGLLFKFETTFAIDIGEDSDYPQEKEYVIPPGIEFIVTYHKKYQNYLEIHFKLVEIKIASNNPSDLVLDASNQQVTLQKFTGNALQRWIFQGRYIRNCGNGKALDIDHRSDKIKNGDPVCTWWLHCRPNQWFLFSDQMIESEITGLVVDVDGGVKEAGSIIVRTKNNKPNQLFDIISL